MDQFEKVLNRSFDTFTRTMFALLKYEIGRDIDGRKSLLEFSSADKELLSFCEREEVDIIDAEIVNDSAVGMTEDFADIYNIYSEEPDYVSHVVEECEKLEIPYRITKVQRFDFISVKCNAIKLAKLSVALNAYGAYDINEVTSEEIATIQSWANNAV